MIYNDRGVLLGLLWRVGGGQWRWLCSSSVMAKSKFEYVRSFEEEERCLANCWLVVRVDGKAFHGFTESHGFSRPNDSRGLKLMSRAAASVMQQFNEISLAFGHSDEYSFVFRKNARIFNRRREKILSLVVSIFSSSYVFHWHNYFSDRLKYPPYFDARIVLYPSDQNMRDYLSWRQADVHINNLYNTCFWALVLKDQMTPKQAEERLRGTVSSEKNELLFQQFNINYNNEEAIFRKGTTLLRKVVRVDSDGDSDSSGDSDQPRTVIVPFYTDIIKEEFWQQHVELLSMTKAPLYQLTHPQQEYFL